MSWPPSRPKPSPPPNFGGWRARGRRARGSARREPAAARLEAVLLRQAPRRQGVGEGLPSTAFFVAPAAAAAAGAAAVQRATPDGGGGRRRRGGGRGGGGGGGGGGDGPPAGGASTERHQGVLEERGSPHDGIGGKTPPQGRAPCPRGGKAGGHGGRRAQRRGRRKAGRPKWNVWNQKPKN